MTSMSVHSAARANEPSKRSWLSSGSPAPARERRLEGVDVVDALADEGALGEEVL